MTRPITRETDWLSRRRRPRQGAGVRHPNEPALQSRGVSSQEHAHSADLIRLGIVVGALGVVFGDIGTSPIYTLQTVFSPEDPHPVPVTYENVFGVVSLVFWSVMLIVTVTYVLLAMRVDNDGEGGIMALITLLRAGYVTSLWCAALWVMEGAWWRWPEQREGGVGVDVAAEAPAAGERGRRSTRSSRGSGSRQPSLRPVDRTAPRGRPRRRRPARPNAGGHLAPPRVRRNSPYPARPSRRSGARAWLTVAGCTDRQARVRSSAPSSASNRCRTSRLCSVLIP